MINIPSKAKIINDKRLIRLVSGIKLDVVDVIGIDCSGFYIITDGEHRCGVFASSIEPLKEEPMTGQEKK